MPEEAPSGLRERKKLDTRKALSDAALELMFERGLDNFVREDVAARAGVSLRTFSNYFASKYDALAYRVNHRIRRSAALLRTRPADEPMWTAIAEALIEPLREDGVPFGRPTDEQIHEIRKLNATPEMQVALARNTVDDLVEAIAERTGTDPEADLYPRLVANVTIGALNAVLNRYVRTDPALAMSRVLREVFDDLSKGLPPPRA
ncbi:TetR family transcriptional regulator [Paractinoplanes ferrugineus]|uniref:TetR family transcriptional regulator n=1 Tax=Paractinoplanes ferrugineus TaxID=113564 RepID=A0A919J949_9ACTN|nr:TetR family transcriptional regulator [Actinoplanes ferrugineus]GIE15328.1 TetR family transcriptional regulator [Actinoplanes ferrugineus]